VSEEQPIVVCLGRFGDILNALPVAHALSCVGPKPKFCVSEEFWTVLEGCSYVQPIVWKVDYKELPWAINRVKGHKAYIAQSYMHPDQSRQTNSYQKEAWRHAGWLDSFGLIPLVIDQRNPAREKDIDFRASCLTNPYHVNKTTILVAGASVSSPFRHDLTGIVRKEFPGHNVVDWSAIRAHRIYDLLGLMDNAACLVTVDSAPLHLARASKVPIVAIINDGWLGSVLQGNVVSVTRYSEFSKENLVDSINASFTDKFSKR